MIQVTFPSGKKRDYPSGTLVEAVIADEEFRGLGPIVAVMVNNDTASLTYRIEINCNVAPVLLDTRIGANVYRRSLCFLLTIAARELFPDKRLVIGHSLGKGYFYYFDGMDRVPDSDLMNLEQRMKELVSEAHPIRRKVVSYLEALQSFELIKQEDTVLLLKYRNDPKIPIYTCGSYLDLAHAPLVPNTSVLQVFEILSYPPGFVLGYPPWKDPQKMIPFKPNPALFSVFQEYKNWGKILNVSCVGRLNDMITSRRAREFIEVTESLHDRKISNIADRINERRDQIRLILIAGPSSSGKTTFSKKLAIQLRVLGRNPVPISLDDYFQPRELTPMDEQGNYNFEALEAIDIELLNQQIIQLLQGKKVQQPQFDFHRGGRKPETKALVLPRRSVLILEGIHGLNELLTARIPSEQKFNIYVSALTQLNLDDHNRISTTDNRLLRRIVRDHQFRGHSAFDTLSMWASVRRGEELNIFPFQNSADAVFNSALDYELAVLKVYAEPLLKTIKPNSQVFYEARGLLSFLDNFAQIPPSWVPEHSILREFIGESAFKY